jgi:hypothetical protein
MQHVNVTARDKAGGRKNRESEIMLAQAGPKHNEEESFLSVLGGPFFASSAI